MRVGSPDISPWQGDQDLEEELEDHTGVNILLGDGGQPQVRPLDVEERGPGDVGHRGADLEERE